MTQEKHVSNTDLVIGAFRDFVGKEVSDAKQELRKEIYDIKKTVWQVGFTIMALITALFSVANGWLNFLAG